MKQATRPPLPRLPGGPDPAAPVPRDPIRGVDLGTYAEITARLAERREPRATTLASFGLDEPRWLDIETGWLLRLATAAMQQDLSLGASYDEAYREAQAALGPTDPTRSLEHYASLLGQIEAGQAPSEVLARAKLSLADWTRLHRAWTARIAADPATAEAFHEFKAGRQPG